MKLIALLLLLQLTVYPQAPNISYTTPQTYPLGVPINPLTPTNIGGAVPAVVYGQVTTVAGSGTEGYVNGMGTAASFNTPSGIAVDASNNIYVADQYNHSVRKIAPNGLVTTFAGNGSFGSSDGLGNAARFQYPYGLATDAAGNVYVADTGNTRIRKITPAGMVTTFAGNGTFGDTDGSANIASFNQPVDVIVAATGTIYVTDHNNNKIRKITPLGEVSTLAGNGTTGAVNGNGNTASFNTPFGMSVDADENIYVAERLNRMIRKITSSGFVTTFAGNGTYGATDGDASLASFAGPGDTVLDRSGNVYVGDSGNHKIRKITPSGMVSSFAGTGVQGSADGIRSEATFNFPCSLTLDIEGNLLIGELGSDSIRKIIMGGYEISPGLPAGLVFNSATGTISGVPTVQTPATVYTVIAYNMHGGSSTTIVISTVVMGTTSFTKSDVIIYPNPAQDHITVLFPEQNQTAHRIVITDLTGKLLIEQSGINDQIQINQLNSGSYILQIFTENGKHQIKFIKE